jgi:thiol-disulfide isomerase/thioredoxin
MSPLRLSALLIPALALLLASPAAAAEAQKDQFDDLIGKPAPEIADGFALNGKAVKLADLKGKVVMIDFWAVWCGPCVATFPHLRELNKEYKDKGLEIVGLTSYYEQYGFDAKAGRLIRARQKLSKQDEQSMLKEFAAHHKLEHRLIAIPRDEIRKVYEAYKVTGIPEVVLIDRQGKVRLVKVGSGEANAKAITAMIKELIAEKD